MIYAASLIKNCSRDCPDASASTIQRGALPRPVQVSPVVGLRYFGGTALRAAPDDDLGADVFALAGALPSAAVISSIVMLYSFIERTMD